jgi:pimeloyl-ACP methyl ester carboxylesterase
MQLFSREVGNGPRTVVILHGLYGVSDNWMTIATSLSEKFRVILPDQRNHGRSPHQSEHTYEALASDLLDLFREKGLEKVILVGHSMGGKTAMRFTLDHPEFVEHLVVIDIAPKDYSKFANYAETTANHDYIIDAMLSVNPTPMANRSEIDAALKKLLPNKTLRQFLMKNIRRSPSGQYQWQLNLEALKINLPEIMDGFSKNDKGAATTRSEVPSLFIKGGQSPYIKDEDSLIINRFFPKSQIVTIPNAGHWLHAEQPELFLKTLLYFID